MSRVLRGSALHCGRDLRKNGADMSMTYFSGLVFPGAEEVPDCRVQLAGYRADSLALNYLWRGRIHFCAEGEARQELVGPMAYWTLPGVSYVYGNVPGESWHQLWVMADGPRVRRMLRGGLVPVGAQPWARPQRPEEFLLRLRELIGLVRRGRADDGPRMTAGLEGLFLELSVHGAEVGAAQAQGAAGGVRMLAEALSRAPERAWDFRVEAARLGVSFAHFRRLFREDTGRGPVDYLIDCRLRAATAWLRKGAGSVKEAAYAAGFRDAHDLARLMRRRLGFAPSSLRTSASRGDERLG